MGHADDARIGQRIAEQALQAGAGHRQRRPDDHRQQRTRHAQVPHHRDVALAQGAGVDQAQLVRDHVHHVARRNAQRSDAE